MLLGQESRPRSSSLQTPCGVVSRRETFDASDANCTGDRAGRVQLRGTETCYGRSMTLVGQIAELQNYATYKELSWEGSFEDYLALVRRNPQITRTAYQRLYDMVLSHGVEEYIDNKKKLVRYKFFRDETHGGRDAVFGLDVPLMRLMNVLKSAAQGYGTERRIILLHGPVGSAKSTIARQLKKGLE